MNEILIDRRTPDKELTVHELLSNTTYLIVKGSEKGSIIKTGYYAVADIKGYDSVIGRLIYNADPKDIAWISVTKSSADFLSDARFKEIEVKVTVEILK